MTTDARIQRLIALMDKVRLRLSPTPDNSSGAADAGWIIGYEKESHPVAALPLDDLDPDAEAAEIMAVAAAFDAAVKYPGSPTAAATLREDTATVLPKIERARFVTAYDAVIAARGDGDGARIFHRPFADDLVVTYVHDGGWRFSYIVRARVDAWQASGDTVHSVARSNLYHKQPLDHRASTIAHGDGYDAARAVIAEDVFYDRATSAGIPLAVPGRDQLLLGPDLDAAAVRAAYDAASYPISPRLYAFEGHALRPL